jgi:endonuclease/exonuclease/phosphatase family metal-dependent hydrolase
MSIRIATFNVENLFARYRFAEGFDPDGDDGFTVNNLAFEIYNDDLKRVTAKAIKEVDADVLCLQEVENIHVLERFNSNYLGGMRYRHRLLIDSHDPRFIDVAVLSRYPFRSINTHRDQRNAANTTWLFSRDCLEADVAVNGHTLSLYVNHLKSMMDGRAETHARRLEQAQAVANIVNARWAPGFAGNFVVLGDMNDYEDAQTSLTPLLTHAHLVNVVRRLPAADQWTHYWAGGNEYRQLDYLLLSQALANHNPGTPGVMRKGLPHRATQYTGPRFPEVGEDDPKASDHAPVSMDINLI